ncbi:BofC C-terminal domain-containing protein [Shouchella patagoniensis]|uniref:BofC C-terminal domain-containing protein n=1 Tax=Shouchella patagoniensis TaxID=228576 RepID=UPI000995ADA4|nr:BofC C-terminal domain-containing protein [Shouchella patagoniensis]
MIKQLVNRNWIPFALGAVSVGFFYGSFSLLIHEEQKQETSPINVESEQVYPSSTEVLLETVFADGQIRQERLNETIWAMEDFWAEYEDWQLIDQSVGFAHFRQNILDVSPEVKRDGYIGLTEDMEVILYVGQLEAMDIVHIYNDISVSELTTNQLLELSEGIRIKDLQMLTDTLEKLY